MYRMVLLADALFFSTLSIIFLIFQFEDWPYSVLFIVVLGIPPLIGFVCWSLWKVEILPEGFIYRNYFGVKHEYKFSDLEFKMHSKGLKWYFYKNGRKILCMPYYVKDENKLERAYKKFIQKLR